MTHFEKIFQLQRAIGLLGLSALAALYLTAMFLSPKSQIRLAVAAVAVGLALFLFGLHSIGTISFVDAGPGFIELGLAMALIFSSAVIALIGRWRGRRSLAAQRRAAIEAFGPLP